MSETKKVFLGMSGGVDSSIAAEILKTSGYDVHGVTHVMCDGAGRDAQDARDLCAVLGIPHTTLDIRNEFRKEVMEYFADEYEAGRTPNPCVRCNEKIKFPYLFDIAEKENALVATGHYARIEKQGDRYLLLRGKDEKKDQSYVLWRLKADQLSKIIFPLGAMTKAEAKQLAADKGFSAALKRESQDICFIPDGDYASFIKSFRSAVFREGDYLSTDGKILGRHSGHMNYTPGQTRGLGIALGKKMYVVSKDAAANTVVIGDKADVMKKTVRARDINFLASDSIPDNSRFTVKIRYGKNDVAASVTQTGEDELCAVFDEPVAAPSPGQSMVIYDGDVVIGGGIII